MNSILYNKEIPIFGSYDVVVIGGGPAGSCAAIEAARNGAQVLLIEACGMLGGMGTTALVGPFMTCYDSEGKNRIVKGLFDEIVNRMIAIGGAESPDETEAPSRYTSYIERYHHHVTPYDSFAFQLVLDQMMKEEKIKVLLYTRYVDSICIDGKIDTLILNALEGLIAVKGKVFIDCTGNADVADRSGVRTWKGTEAGEVPQPGTLFFEVNHVDDDRYDDCRTKPVKAYRTNRPGTYKVNAYRVSNLDACSSESMTDGHMRGRLQVLEAFQVLKTNSGFENAQISQVAPVLGNRESRHVECQYCVTVQDLIDGKVFEDGIMVFGYGMDVHPRSGEVDPTKKTPVALEYTIPYRALLPIGCDNLLIAGKTICAESEAAGSFRVMPGCMAIGQAAGAAAAMAVRDDILPGDIDTDELRDTLRKHDVILR